jgi:hypothetical protein
MNRLFAAILLLLPLAASGQNIYRTTDENGNVVFTDRPAKGSTTTEQVEIQQTNTTPATPIPPRADPQAAEPEEEEYSVNILSPDNETSFPMGAGNFSVSAEVSPGLTGGHALQLYVGAAPWGAPQSSTDWDLTNVFRGAHDLTVAVVDSDGEQVAVSPPIRVFVHRPSVNFRNRR